MIITIWERLNPKKGIFEHNHIKEGYRYEILAPYPKSEMQRRSWKNAIWLKGRGRLVNGVVRQEEIGGMKK